MKYRIKKGRKYAFPPFPILAIGRKNILQWKVRFDESCIYVDGNQTDIQKLCGIGWFPSHHTNSARFGWRWNIQEHKIELLAYCYDKGVRISSASTERSVCFVDFNTDYFLELHITDTSYQFIVSGTNGFIGNESVDKTFKAPFIGFYMKPYYESDGSLGAPHDMLFNITKQ